MKLTWKVISKVFYSLGPKLQKTYGDIKPNSKESRALTNQPPSPNDLTHFRIPPRLTDP